jgi:hypothetical protein
MALVEAQVLRDLIMANKVKHSYMRVAEGGEFGQSF